MKILKSSLFLLALITAILACKSPPTQSASPAPVTPSMEATLADLYIESQTGSGQFNAELFYYEGSQQAWITCGYRSEKSGFIPPVIATFQTESGQATKSRKIPFEEKRPGNYTAYCAAGSSEVTVAFKVTYPYFGTFSCRECITQLWAEEVSMVTEPPRRMGGTSIKVIINEDGAVTGGNMYYEVFGAQPGYCVIGRYVFEGVQAGGWVNPDNSEVTVDYSGTETYEYLGGQCQAPVVIPTPQRFYFLFNDQGELLLCSATKKGQNCLDQPYAILWKE